MSNPRISDILRFKSKATEDFVLKVQTIAQAIIAICIILGNLYLIASGIEISPLFQNGAWIILGAYFGLRAIATQLQRNGK